MSAHIDPAELGELQTAPADDPRRAHLRECARCRAVGRAHDAFVGDATAPAGARLAEAERQLGEFLDREIAGVRPAPSAARPGWLDWLLAPPARPVWAVACAALIAGGAWFAMRARSPEPVVLRGAPPVAPGSELELFAPEIEGDLVTLSWRPARAADAYEVRLFSVALDEVGRIAPGPDTFAVLRPRQAARGVRRGDDLLYRVVALAHGDQVGMSTLGTLRVR